MGIEIRAKTNYFSSRRLSCSVSKQIIAKFVLDKDSQPQTYGLGIKEFHALAAKTPLWQHIT